MSEREGEDQSQPVTPATPSEAAAPSAPPRDPQAFRLRGPQPRVVRLSRKVLAVIGAAAGLGIGGSLTYALQHKAPSPAPPKSAASEGRAKSEIVTAAPDDYSKVPKLGQPLPGDLGRPILAAQQNGVRASTQSDPRIAAAEQGRQRLLQEREAARNSRLFQAVGSVSAAESGVDGGGIELSAAVSDASGTERSAGDDLSPAAVDTNRSAKRAFLERRGAETTESAARIMSPRAANILQAGTIIPAALITGIQSDLPGQITAQVTQNVYDSPTGRLLLIPQGARLLGDYDSEVSAGQRRVLLAWNRLIFPDGRSILLDRQPGTDAAGMAGLRDRTNFHWGNMLRAVAISTLLGVGSEIATGSDDSLTRALRYGTQDTVNRTGRQLVQREMNVSPTLTIRPGYPLRVLLTRDLILEPVEGVGMKETRFNDGTER